MMDIPGTRLVEFKNEVRTAIRRTYDHDNLTASGVIAGLDSQALKDSNEAGMREAPLDDLIQLASEAPVIKLVNLLLLEALEARASDVHLESYTDSLRIRYRIDGVLQDAPSPSSSMTPAIVSRIKIMAELDIAERRVPQNGRIRLNLQNRRVDVRVSAMPVLHGESIVLRILDKESGRIGLQDLGMSHDVLDRFEKAISSPHGIILATGPTGSGKTTTLYAAIDHIRTGREKIITVEDPVEYELEGVPQVPVNEKLGLTFAEALRNLLRQDPDVMLVGEIRDPETAEVAMQAALTGHLVLSTLHTNDAPSALIRLMELGVAPYLVASTVEAVLAQRLVRANCLSCANTVSASDTELHSLGVSREEIPNVIRGDGCQSCRGTGYRGRAGMYELLIINDEFRTALGSNPNIADLRKLAALSGMRTLLDDGVRLIRQGVTTPEEVTGVVGTQ